MIGPGDVFASKGTSSVCGVGAQGEFMCLVERERSMDLGEFPVGSAIYVVQATWFRLRDCGGDVTAVTGSVHKGSSREEEEVAC